MILDLLPFVLGAIVGYKFPVKQILENPFFGSLQLLMSLFWMWAITRPIIIILVLFGAG